MTEPLAFADRVFFGSIVTMHDAHPEATAVAVRAGRITAVGDRADVASLIGPDTQVSELGSSVLLPGFVEAHGHPLSEAVMLGTQVLDIRPVVIDTAAGVQHALDQAIKAAGTHGVYASGWDSLLQVGLVEPTREWLNALSPNKPLAILHNSGHFAYFNDAAAAVAGVTRDTADPVGASFARDAQGDLTGIAREIGAVEQIFSPALASSPADFVSQLAAESRRLNAAGITTSGELSYSPATKAGLDAASAAGALTVRLRLYEMSTAAQHSDARPGEGDELVRQVGIKMWADGSPWVGNIATSFPYLDTDATRALGLEPHHHGQANYTPEQIEEISAAYFSHGWQLACHVHGDDAVDSVLDAWERVVQRHPRDDHRLRLEHVGAMTPAQFVRAASLGVTASVFIDHLYYWGDVLVDDLFGTEHGAPWARAGSALAAGLRISFHNDGSVTPPEPLRNIEIAATRRSKSGRLLAPEERITVAQALRAETIDSAFQLFSDHEVGSIEPGKLADFVVLGSSPLAVDPTAEPAGSIADIPVLETILGGVTVYTA